VEIKRKELVNVLEQVKKGLAKRDLIEQSTAFIFTNKQVMTFNDEIFAMSNTDLDIEGVVEAEPLLKLLNKVKDETIRIESEDNELKIKGKKFSAGVSFDPEIRIPIDNINTPKKLKKLSSEFTNAAKLACLTAGKSLSEPLFTCVHIHKNIIESCDNDRITICELEQSFDFDILVPADNLLEICKEKLTAIHVDDSWIYFKTDNGVILATKLYNEEYKDLHQFIPEENEGKIIEFPKQINEIINRADIFSKDTVLKEKNVKINIKKGKLTIKSQNEQGWFKETTKVDFKEDLSFSINLEFLEDILKITNQISIIDEILYFKTDKSIHIVQLEGDD